MSITVTSKATKALYYINILLKFDLFKWTVISIAPEDFRFRKNYASLIKINKSIITILSCVFVIIS